MIYTVDDISERWQCSKLTVYEMLKAGELPAFRVKNQWRVNEDELYKFEHTPTNSKGGLKDALLSLTGRV